MIGSHEGLRATRMFIEGEEMVTTPEHQFYVPRPGWTGAIHLRAGDVLVLSKDKYVTVEKLA